ncbi:MAG: UDP-N-acetylmuramate dehydrogenase [Patescibacteria group bacterium]|nr:UDP-N-acetylmuramate dehydrogenase [Patescibacteria group bacterium]
MLTKDKINNLNLKIEKDKDIFSYLTMRVHAKAEYFFVAKTREELICAKKFSLRKKIPFLVIGGGSNVVPKKEKISGLIVINRYLKMETLKEDKERIELLVSSGYPVSFLVSQTIEKGWEGFEYHLGLPGTVGGAIYMNSKWTKPLNYFGDNLLYAFLLDKEGKIKKVNRDYLNFDYDYSILQETNEILLEAVFRLRKNKPEILKKRADEVLDYRKKTQPKGVATVGCFFRNPGLISAGYLIDKAGLKGLTIGGFQVSDLHANFIINKKEGKLSDLKKLITIIKDQIKKKFGIKLKEEAVFLS